MERIVTMFQAYWGHVKSMLGANWEKINVVLDSDEHRAQGSTKETLTFALKESCSLLFCR
jgi:hypothetical protein